MHTVESPEVRSQKLIVSDSFALPNANFHFAISGGGHEATAKHLLGLILLIIIRYIFDVHFVVSWEETLNYYNYYVCPILEDIFSLTANSFYCFNTTKHFVCTAPMPTYCKCLNGYRPQTNLI